MLRSALVLAASMIVFALSLSGSVQARETASAKKTPPKKTVIARKNPTSSARAMSPNTKKVAAASEKQRRAIVSRARLSAVKTGSFTSGAQAGAGVQTAGDLSGLHRTKDPLSLKSNAAVVIDQSSRRIIFEKNSQTPLPIASLTKLMTAMVVIEAQQNLDEIIEVTVDDIDRDKNTSSRLRVGSRMTREDMLHIALMSSENRAASALGRNYPGGKAAFVTAMNALAKSLGMHDTRFVESTGLSSQNVSSAQDLSRLVVAAHKYPLIRHFSTDEKYVVDAGNYSLDYVNSNRLVSSPGWEIGLQKTGYIVEAGRCLVMQASIVGRPVVMVFLDSKGKDSRLGDASRIRRWLELDKPWQTEQAVARRG